MSERSDMSACGLLFKINEYIGSISGADPGFQVRGGALKKMAPSGAWRENVWGISCEKNLIFSNSPPPPLNLHDSNKLNLFMVRICLV